MTDRQRESVQESFPYIDTIGDDDLRDGIVTAWTKGLEETGWTLDEVPWLPPVQRDLDLPDEYLVDHVNDVCDIATAIADNVANNCKIDFSYDLLIAGALIHDISKLYEFDSAGDTPVYEMLGHPYYGVYIIGVLDLPVELAHVILSHTDRTTVEPATMEAEIIRRSDEVAASAIRMKALNDLRNS